MPSKIHWQFNDVDILADDQINEHFNVLDGEIKTNKPSDEPMNEFCQQKNPDNYHRNCYFGTLMYTPSLDHDGKIIQCSVRQDLFTPDDYGTNINKRKIKLVVGAIKPQEILVRCQGNHGGPNEVTENYTIIRYVTGIGYWSIIISIFYK